MSYISYIDMNVSHYIPNSDGSFQLESVPEYMVKPLEEAINGFEHFEYGDVKNGYGGEVNHDYYVEDLKGVSAKFPDVLFSLHRCGEDTGDLSEEYFLSGGYQCCPAIIHYEDFDPKKLDGGEVPQYKPEVEIDVGSFM